MDPNSGMIYDGETVDSLRRQYADDRRDKPLNAMLKRLMPLTPEEAVELIAQPIRQRIDWAKDRNARKRASRERRGR